MPKQGTRAEVNTFVKGLITEASPLNFPANASFDEENFELLRNGTRRRRLGMKKEGSSFDAPGNKANAKGSYIWNSVRGDAGVEFTVVQVGNILTFLSTIDGVVAGSFQGKLTLEKFPSDKRFSFATVNGSLVIASGGALVYCVTYDGKFNLTERTLKVRDVWGVEEEDAALEADATIQPTVLTETHKYNLQNQSWGIPRKTKTGFPTDPVAYYDSELSKHPSNTETVWTGLQFQSVEDGHDPYERMFNSLYIDRLGADLKAARGYYVIELLNRGTSRLEAVARNHAKYSQIPLVEGLKKDFNKSGPSVVCEFAGRMFYSGFDGIVEDGDARSPSLADYVVFSQLVQNDVDIDLCYQVGDPSSRESSDVLDTDGGFISVSGARNIVALHNLGSRLLVFASNGVWSISGGSDYGFTASNYKVDKLSTFGCVSGDSIVAAGSNLMYWGKTAIYAVTPDNMGGYSVQDITAATIQSFYNKVPEEAKKNSQGVFDPVDKKIRWLYWNGGMFSSNAQMDELVFDTVLNSFYRHKIKHASDYKYQIVGVNYSELATEPIRYLVMENTDQFSFATYGDTNFLDWGETDAKAYLITGAITANDSGIDKQVPYVTVHLMRTETGTDSNGVPMNQSSCLMSGRWEWANSLESHKISGLYEVYKYRTPLYASPDSSYDNGFDTVISKNKLRGRGKAVTLYFETSPNKDCQLLGWNLTINGNAIT